MPTIPIAAAKVAAKAIESGLITSGALSKSLIGYNFVDLMVKLIIFYTVALIISKIMELIIFAQSGLSTAASLFGIPLPSTVPNAVRKLFSEGYNVAGMKFKFWDLIKLLAVVLVVMEMLRYMEFQKAAGMKPEPMTVGVFVLIISAVAILSIPELYQMIKDQQVIKA